MKKEMRNRRILAIIAVLVIATVFFATGQTSKLKYKIVNDTILSIDVSASIINNINYVEAVGVDNDGNEIVCILPIINVDRNKNKVNVSFFTLAFFPGNAGGNNPDAIQLIKDDGQEYLFAVDGKKLVDIWYKK